MPDQIVDVGWVGRRMGQVAPVGRIGGSDQSMLGPRDDVHHASVICAREDDGAVAEADLLLPDYEVSSFGNDDGQPG